MVAARDEDRRQGPDETHGIGGRRPRAVVAGNPQALMRARKPVLEVSGLRVERGDTVILRDVSWRVEHGQHWAMLGANGSGKTSLLSALTGYLTPTDRKSTRLNSSHGYI